MPIVPILLSKYLLRCRWGGIAATEEVQLLRGCSIVLRYHQGIGGFISYSCKTFINFNKGKFYPSINSMSRELGRAFGCLLFSQKECSYQNLIQQKVTGALKNLSGPCRPLFWPAGGHFVYFGIGKISGSEKPLRQDDFLV